MNDLKAALTQSVKLATADAAKPATRAYDDLLTPPEAATFLKVSISWLAKQRLYGDGPAYRKVGRSVRYRRVDLDRYLATRLRTSTSQFQPSSPVRPSDDRDNHRPSQYINENEYERR
jgi:hypothetical protein